MGRLSTRSNPTNLKELDRGRITISISENALGRFFTLDRLDLEGLNLPSELKLICVASAGNKSLRFEMGNTSAWSRDSQSIDGLDRSESLKFRILIRTASNLKLLASVENLRPKDDSQAESLLPMEPANLGERLWNLDIRDDGPVLQFNVLVFPSAAGVENYAPFGSLVLPEALRQVMMKIAEDTGVLDDEGDPWHVWSEWLDAIGANRPPLKTDDAEEKELWCKEVIGIFCAKHRFASQLQSVLQKEDGI